MSESFWRNYINNLDVDFPTGGEEAPERESNIATVAQKDEEGHLFKIAYEVYILNSSITGRSFLVHSGEHLYDIGNMSLVEAVRKIKRKKT